MAPDIAILIINRKIDSRRRNYQKLQFSKLRLNFDFIEPVKIKAKPDSGEKGYDTGWTRPLRMAEYSLTLTHMLAWGMCITRNQPVIVLEDDVIIDPEFPKILDHLSALLDHVHFVGLEPGNKKNIDTSSGIDVTSGFKSHRLFVNRGGSVKWSCFPGQICS